MRDYPYSRPVEVEYFTSFSLQLRYGLGNFMKQAGFMRFSMGAAQMETALILAPHIYPDVFRIDRCHRKSCQALDGVLL